MEPVSDDRKRRAALAELSRLAREGDALGGLFRRTGTHFSGADAPAGDGIELWGRRLGRILSAVAFVALAVYLYATYVR